VAIQGKTGNRVPLIVKSNSASAAKDNVVVYLCSPSGVVELAPDGRLSQNQLDRIGYKGWRRCEARGAREIEKLSLIISRQMFEKKKRMKVQQALREMEFLKQAQMLAKVRAAQGFSANDVELNRKREKFWAQRQEAALAVVASEFHVEQRTTALEMEVRPSSTSPWAHIGRKKAGLSA